MTIFLIACDNETQDVPPVKPVVKIEVGEVLEQSVTFTVATQNAVELFWTYAPSTEGELTAEDLKESGTKETEAEFEHTLDQLISATEYNIYALAIGKDGDEALGKASFKTVSPVPSVQMTLYGVTENTATVTIAPVNAQKCSWICLPATEPAPETANILTEGQEVDCSQDFSVVNITELIPSTAYKLYVAVEAYENTAMEILDFTTEEEVIIEGFEATFSACKDMISEGGRHYLKLNDSNWNFEVSLDVYADPSSSHLPAGTYTVQEGTVAPVLSKDYSSISIYNMEGQGSFKLDSGELIVEKTGDSYVLTLNVMLDSGKAFHGEFEGTLVEEAN